MIVQRQAFSRLLSSSPPALRSEVARWVLSQETARTFGTTTAVGNATLLRGTGSTRGGRIPLAGLRRAPLLLQGKTRFQSTTTSAGSATSTPPPNLPNLSSEKPSARSGLTRTLTTTALVIFCLTTGFAMSAAPAAETVNGYINPPSDLETLSLYTPPTPTAEAINEHILSHPLAVKLRAQENVVESRPHMKIPATMRPHNLTGGTLMGSEKIEVPPLNFSSRGEDLPTLVQIAYLGPALCGHPGIIHGGLLATLLDEGLARACFPALPNKVGVTASLKIDYRSPCPAGSYIVLKAETTKVEGRKAWVKGWIEVLGEDGEGEGTKVVEAEALFVEPKGAKGMARVYSSQ